MAASEVKSLTPQLDPWFFPDDHPADADERDLVNKRLADLVRLEEHAAYHLAGAAYVAQTSKSYRIDGARSIAGWLASTAKISKADAHRSTRGVEPSTPPRRSPQEEFQKLCNRWRDLADPDAAYARWRRRHERRHLSMAHDLEGSLLFQGRIDGADGEVFFQAIAKRENELFLADWAQAQSDLGRTPTIGELPRTSSQRRLDALADLVRRGSAVTEDGDIESSSDVTINYVLDHFTAQEALDRVFGDEGAGGPEERSASPTTIARSPGVDTGAAFDPLRFSETLDGLPIPPEVIIRDAFRARIRRVVFESSSVIIDAGPARRLFEGAQRSLVKLRDRRCRHPFCTASHWRCEIDHVEDHARGGPTDLANGALYCNTHHDDKTRGRVVVRAGPKGRLDWFRSDGRWLGTS